MKKKVETSPEVPEEVRIDEILLDRFQVRSKIDDGTVRRYASAMKAGLQMPPVQVANINGARVLVDGWHRVAAAKSLGYPRIAAVLFDATEEDARWRAARANLTHGLPLKR